jgi:WD40 repeat protein/tetratricopeptide (TPR) repeat protein
MNTSAESLAGWYYARDRKKVGPHSLEQLRELVRQGIIHRDDMVWQEGAARWIPANSVTGLFEVEATLLPDFVGTTINPLPEIDPTLSPDAIGETLVPGPVAAVAAQEGPSLAGYEIQGELGRGGMGIVYKARQLKLNRLVALKMIRSGAHAHQEERVRFLLEAEAVARLSHPNIVQIYEIGEHDGCPFFCLEFVEGGSLEKQIAGTPQPPREAAALVELLARAMQHAHQAGIVHRDLKPGNVLLAACGLAESPAKPQAVLPKITDFGLARRLEEEDNRLTQTGVVVGTPSYMAPEQARGEAHNIGPLVDVWALGAILYELLTGRPPFKGVSAAETILLLTTTEPVPPRRLAPAVPRDLETICLKCLQKEQAKRYASAGELANDLKRFQAGEPIKARPVGRLARAWRWSRRNPVLATVSLLLLIVFAGGVSGIFWQWQKAVENNRQMQREYDRAEENAARAENKANEERTQRTLAEKREEALLENAYASRMSQLPQDWANGDLASVQGHLDAFLPSKERKKDVRGFEWYRYWKMTRGSRLTLLGHVRDIRALVFTPDSRQLLSGSYDTHLRIWDVATGEQRDAIVFPSFFNQLAFASDKKTLVIAWGPGALQTYDLQKKSMIRDLTALGENSFLLSPDGRFFFAPTGIAIHIRSLLTGEIVGKLPLATSLIKITPDGRTLLCAVGGFIESHSPSGDWDRGEIKRQLRFQAHTEAIVNCALSADGKTLVTVGRTEPVKVWTLDPPDRTPHLRTTIKTNSPTITCMVLSPDGKRFIAAGSDRVIRVWDVSTNRLLSSLRGHAKQIATLAISPDGRHLASGGADAAVKVWDLEEVTRSSPGTREVTAPESPVAFAFSPDNRLLASGGRDAMVRVWDLDKRSQRLLLRGHESDVRGVFFLPGGKELLSVGRDGVVCRWGLEREGKVHKEKVEAEIACCAASVDGATLTCGDELGQVWFLTADGKQPRRAKPHWTRVTALAFSPDGKTLLSGAWDGSVALTDVKSGIAHPCRPQLLNAIVCVTYSLDGKQVLAVENRAHCAAWDALTRAPIGKAEEHGTYCRGVVRHPEGKWLLWASDYGRTGVLVLTDRPRRGDASTKPGLRVSEYGAYSAACSHDGTLVAAADVDGAITLFNTADGKEWRELAGGGGSEERSFTVGRFPGHAQSTLALAYSPDGKWLAQSNGFRVRLLDAATRREQAVLVGHEDMVSALAFSPDSRTLATGSWDRAVKLWDVPSGKPAGSLKGAKFPVQALAFSPDGLTLAAGCGETNSRGQLLHWDVKTRSPHPALPADRWMVRGLAWLADNRTLISTSGDGYALPGDLRMLDVADRKELLRLVPHGDRILALALASSGKLLATGGGDDHMIRLWDIVESGSLRLRNALRGPAQVQSLSFTPDGRTLAACGGDPSIQLWQPERGQSVGQLSCSHFVLTIAFSPDGRTLAAGGAGGELTLLATTTAEEVRRETASVVTLDPGEDLRAETQRLRIQAERNLVRFLVQEGEPATEKERLKKLSADLDRLIELQPQQLNLQREQVEVLLRLVNLQGDDYPARERVASRTAELARKLSEANPSSRRAVELRAEALYRLGYALFQQKQYNDALPPMVESLELIRRLDTTETDRARDWKGQVATTIHLLAAVQKARYQLVEANSLFRQAIALHQAHLRTAAVTEGGRRVLSSSLAAFLELATLQLQLVEIKEQKWWDEVLDAWRLLIALFQQRLLQAPQDVALHNDMIRWLRLLNGKIFRVCLRDKRLSLDEVDDCYRQAIVHLGVVVKLRPDSKYPRENLCAVYDEWGDILEDAEQYRRAETAYARLIEERKVLLDQEPRVVSRRAEYCNAIGSRAWAVGKQLRFEDAARFYREALQVNREALAQLGEKEELRSSRRDLLLNWARVELHRNDHAVAFKQIEESIPLLRTKGEDWWTAGVVLARCERAANVDAQLPAEEKKKLMKHYADRTMEALRKAVDIDPDKRELLRTSSRFDGLRQREDFKKLLKGGSR